MNALDPYYKMAISLIEAGSETKSIIVHVPENEFWSLLADSPHLYRGLSIPVLKSRVITERPRLGSNWTGQLKNEPTGAVMREVYLPDIAAFTREFSGVRITFIRLDSK